MRIPSDEFSQNTFRLLSSFPLCKDSGLASQISESGQLENAQHHFTAADPFLFNLAKHGSNSGYATLKMVYTRWPRNPSIGFNNINKYQQVCHFTSAVRRLPGMSQSGEITVRSAVQWEYGAHSGNSSRVFRKSGYWVTIIWGHSDGPLQGQAQFPYRNGSKLFQVWRKARVISGGLVWSRKLQNRDMMLNLYPNHSK